MMALHLTGLRLHQLHVGGRLFLRCPALSSRVIKRRRLARGGGAMRYQDGGRARGSQMVFASALSQLSRRECLIQCKQE